MWQKLDKKYQCHVKGDMTEGMLSHISFLFSTLTFWAMTAGKEENMIMTQVWKQKKVYIWTTYSVIYFRFFLFLNKLGYWAAIDSKAHPKELTTHWLEVYEKDPPTGLAAAVNLLCKVTFPMVLSQSQILFFFF